jgi:hypothetical protein
MPVPPIPERVTVPLEVIPVSPVIVPVATRLPLLATVNLVAPLALAVKILPELVWLIIAAALLPIPPETDSGAGVLADEPILTPELKSDVRMVLPEPAGVNVRSVFVPVVIVNVPLSAIW